MGSKGTSSTAKKESWKDLKEFQEKKKQQETSNDSDIFERGVVHATWLLQLWAPGVGLVSPAVTVMTTSYFLVLEPPSLRGSVEIGSLGGTPSPRVRGVGGRSTTSGFVDLGPKVWALHPSLWV